MSHMRTCGETHGRGKRALLREHYALCDPPSEACISVPVVPILKFVSRWYYSLNRSICPAGLCPVGEFAHLVFCSVGSLPRCPVPVQSKTILKSVSPALFSAEV